MGLRGSCRHRRCPLGSPARARFTAAALAAALAALAGAPAAPAAPVISIKAHAAVKLGRVHRSPDGRIAISGRVVDRGSGQGVAYALVDIHLDHVDTPLMSDEDGRFHALFPSRGRGGLHDLEVDYDGDGHHTAARAALRRFDVAKEPLALSLSLPDQVPTSAPDVEVALTARADTEPAPITADLYAGPDDGGSLERVGHITTDTTGRGTARIACAALGKPGTKRIEARFAGNRRYNQASARGEIDLVADTALSFRLERSRVSLRDTVRGRGRLVRTGGAPVAGAAIALSAGGRRLAEALTAADGSFALSVPASEIGRGPVLVQAIFEPSRPSLGGSRSPPLRLDVAPAGPVPIGSTLAAFALTALCLAAFVLLRTRPWQRWGRTGRRRARAASPAARAPAPQTGLNPARPRLVSTLRRPHDTGIAGTICDAATSAPIAGAAVILDGGDLGEREARSSPAGRFALDALAAGRWQVEVSAPGYVSERFAIAIPHRGELRGARIQLLPVRERIFALYRETAEPLLPSERLWGVWTPRQILDHVRRGHPAAALAALTDYVEEAYFSQRVPEESSLGEATARADAARRELAAE